MGKGFSDYYTNREQALDLKKSAVLIVDMMNDFCKPGGRMVLEDVVAKAETLLEKEEAMCRDIKSGMSMMEVDKKYNYENMLK